MNEEKQLDSDNIRGTVCRSTVAMSQYRPKKNSEIIRGVGAALLARFLTECFNVL